MTPSFTRFNELDLQRLEAETFLAAVEFHETLGSTSDRALQLCQDATLATPLLVLTNEQTAGRGRGANRWWSAEGAVAFSLIIDPAQQGLSLEQLPLVSLATGLALCEALSACAPNVEYRLKWPNDLYASAPIGEPRKLAGILLERPPGPVPRLVIGIGMNVANSLADAPEEVRRRAAALSELSGHAHRSVDLVSSVLIALADMLDLLATGRLRLVDEWHRHCLLRGREVVALSGQRRVSGICRGIGQDGALLIEHGSTMERLFSATIDSFI